MYKEAGKRGMRCNSMWQQSGYLYVFGLYEENMDKIFGMYCISLIVLFEPFKS